MVSDQTVTLIDTFLWHSVNLYAASYGRLLYCSAVPKKVRFEDQISEVK